jgi:site-specific DNA-methyltransferase (adenine-specific)
VGSAAEGQAEGGGGGEVIEVIHGDCLEVMKTLDAGSIDAVVTDPPYGIGYKSGPISRNSISTTQKRFSITIEGDENPFDPTPWLSIPMVAFTGAQYIYDRLPSGGSIHCWDKRGDYKPLDQADADMIWISRPCASRVFHLAWRGICRHAEHDRRIEHPTQKPIALMKWIMELLGVPVGSTVLDPFAGSGTTGVACMKTGRRCILIEKDERYLPVIHRRLKEAETPLFASLSD